MMQRYRMAAEGATPFVLESANDVICARPPRLKGRPLLSLDTKSLKPYPTEDINISSSTSGIDDAESTSDGLDFEVLE